MKTIAMIAAALLSVLPSATSAQDSYYYPPMQTDDNLFAAHFSGEVRRDLAQRSQTRRVLSSKRYLLGDEHLWSNGVDLAFGTVYDAESGEIWLNLRIDGAWQERKPDDPISPLKVSRGRVTAESDNKLQYGVERFGAYVMLVARNADNAPVSAYYLITDGEANNYAWTAATRRLLAGNYAMPDGRHAVFGPRLPHYAGSEYDTDPGEYAYRTVDDFRAIEICYGGGRVNRGDPSSPNYDKMPGGGGAGALMEPMLWRLTVTEQGMQVKHVHDVPFVDHCPRVPDGAELTLAQSPYEGIDGRWPITSVVPLTHQLLRLLPRELLTLMRGEIYARHGDTFADPDTQRYFDRQPWYKRREGRVTLTDIERFNYALIKHVENSI